MSTLETKPENDLRAVFIAIRRELAGAEGHLRAYDDILQARTERGLELLPFHDFFELR